MRLAQEQHFIASITYHTKGPMLITPYVVGERTNPTPDIARHVAEQIAPAELPVKSSMYPVSGSDQDWLYHTFGTLAYIYEGDRHNPLAPEKRQNSVDVARPTFKNLFNHILNGPRLQGFVKTTAGQPLRARVDIEGHVVHHDEQWTTRADGRFDRMVLDVTPVTVRFTRLDTQGTTEIQMTPGATPITITLDD